ncbi:hypothetical protein [Mammaliicoccus sciuri]|uniref:hypothetical protein n=1 Tax=Mammaliicoccus sciuri TaxID=1296 RepID=UPI000D1E5B17|nr:hypothetical protein [Mammaliicoccus sciuri]PTJ54221.1 hypothetical protein BU012_01090 [Mammaliicoccus sciuri]
MAITVEVNGQKIVFDTVEEFKAFQMEETEETVEDIVSESEPVSYIDKIVGAKYIIANSGTHSFKEGEVVTLIHDDSTIMPYFENEEGYRQYVMMTDVRLLLDSVDTSEYVNHEDLKVGDRFTFESLDDKLTFDFTTGKVYTVTKGHRPRVVVDDRGHELFDHNFDLFNGIKLDTDDSAPKLKVGDTVRVLDDISDAGYYHSFNKGDVGVIVETPPNTISNNRYEVDVDGRLQYLKPESLQLVTKTGPKFKVGDRVVIMEDADDAGYYHCFDEGDIGKITFVFDDDELDCGDINYEVAVDHQFISQTMSQKSLELASTVEDDVDMPTEETVEFKVGDIDVITGNTNYSDNNIGDIGIINEIDDDETAIVIVDNADRNSSCCWTEFDEMRHAADREKVALIVANDLGRVPSNIDMYVDSLIDDTYEVVEGAYYVVKEEREHLKAGEIVRLVRDDKDEVPAVEKEDGTERYTLESNLVRLRNTKFTKDADEKSYGGAKVGDTIRITDASGHNFAKGSEVTVTRLIHGVVEATREGDGLTQGLRPSQFEIVGESKDELDLTGYYEIDEKSLTDGDFIIFTKNTYVSSREFVTGKLYKVEDRYYEDENGQRRGIGSLGHERTVDVMEFYRKKSVLFDELENGDIVYVKEEIVDYSGDKAEKELLAEIAVVGNTKAVEIGSTPVIITENDADKLELVCKANHRTDI